MLWKVSVATTAAAEDAVAELLQRLLSHAASSYTDVETGEVTVSVFLPQKPARHRAALRGGLAHIVRCGLDTGAGRISFRKLRAQDWAESWKRHFRPIEISRTLLLKPGWSKRPARKGQAVVVLDPGLSFGTGQHPTTRFCLEQLAEQRALNRPRSFLDMGTGSGVLAIAAAKLGYSPVEALDNDADAVRVARANARRNQVPGRIRFRRVDLASLPLRGRRYDLICANLLAGLLLEQRRRILARLKAGGTLVLAGILDREFGPVRRAYERAGLRLVASRVEDEWRSGAFRRG